jgi:hypothetical protein
VFFMPSFALRRQLFVLGRSVPRTRVRFRDRLLVMSRAEFRAALRNLRLRQWGGAN